MISDGKNRLIKIGGNADVVNAFCSCYEEFKNQPTKLVRQLKEVAGIGGADRESVCEAVFGYMCENVRYQLDPDGEQYIKSPARLLKDGCGDCKSLTMFIASCLHCLGIPCIVRFVNFDGGNQYTHVYPVAILENGREFILDMCETDEDGVPFIDYAREYARKKDIVYGK